MRRIWKVEWKSFFFSLYFYEQETSISTSYIRYIHFLYITSCPWHYCLHFPLLVYFPEILHSKLYTYCYFKAFVKGILLMFDWKFHKKFSVTQRESSRWYYIQIYAERDEQSNWICNRWNYAEIKFFFYFKVNVLRWEINRKVEIALRWRDMMKTDNRRTIMFCS